jgi:hypothetical protein
MLERQGFVEIQEQVIKVPLNPWPADPHLKDIGRWYNLGLTQGLEALSLGPFTRVNLWTKADVDRLIAEVKKDVCSKRFHVYCNMYVPPFLAERILTLASYDVLILILLETGTYGSPSAQPKPETRMGIPMSQRFT